MNKTILSTLLSLTIFMSGCQFSEHEADPFEKFNRNAYNFHMLVEDYVYLPLYGIYQEALPVELRIGIANMADNINEVQNIGHDILQGDILFAVSDTWRFLINSTLGLGGFFDVASYMNLPKHHQSFSATFAIWGAEPGPMLVIPGLGAGLISTHLDLVTPFQTYQPIKMTKDLRKTMNTLQAIRFIGNHGDQTLMTNYASDRYAMTRNYLLQKFESYKHRPDYATLKQDLIDENMMNREDEDMLEEDEAMFEEDENLVY